MPIISTAYKPHGKSRRAKPALPALCSN
jgi:hypothetical protein